MWSDDPLVVFNGEKDKTLARKLIASAGGTSGFKKRFRTDINGTVTRLDTKNGMPQITVERKEAPVARQVSEFSALLYSELRPNGVAEGTRTLSTLQPAAGAPYHVKVSGALLSSAIVATPEKPARGVVSWASDTHTLQTGLPYIEPSFRDSREPYPSTINSVLYRYYESIGVSSSANAGNSIDGASATLGQTESRTVEGIFKYGLDGSDVPLGPDGQKPSAVSDRLVGGVQTRTFLNCEFIANGDGTKSFRVLEWIDASEYITDFTIADASLFAGKNTGANAGITKFAFSDSGRKLAVGFYYETISSPDAENRILGWDHNESSGTQASEGAPWEYTVHYSYFAAGVIEINVDTQAFTVHHRDALPRVAVYYTANTVAYPPIPTSLYFQQGATVTSKAIEDFGYFGEQLSALITTFTTTYDGQIIDNDDPVLGTPGTISTDTSNEGHHISAELAFSTGETVLTWAYDYTSSAFVDVDYDEDLNVVGGVDTRTTNEFDWRDVKLVRSDFSSRMFVVLTSRIHHAENSYIKIATKNEASWGALTYETFTPRTVSYSLEYTFFDANINQSAVLLTQPVINRSSDGYSTEGLAQLASWGLYGTGASPEIQAQWALLRLFGNVRYAPANMLHLAVGFSAASTLGVISILAVDNRYDANFSLTTPTFDDIHAHNFVIRKASRTAQFSLSPLAIDGNYPGQKKWLSPLFIPN